MDTSTYEILKECNSGCRDDRKNHTQPARAAGHVSRGAQRACGHVQIPSGADRARRKKAEPRQPVPYCIRAGNAAARAAQAHRGTGADPMNGCPLRRNGRMRIVRKPGRRAALPFVGATAPILPRRRRGRGAFGCFPAAAPAAGIWNDCAGTPRGVSAVFSPGWGRNTVAFGGQV